MIKTRKALFALSLWSAMAATAFAQGTAFTYQGQLSSGGSPANGTYDVQFTLFSVSSGGSAIGSPAVKTGLGITNGLFTTALDFGSVFNGTTNWLELAVRTNGASSFSPPLTPRQQLTPTPNAIFAETVGSVSASSIVGSLPAGDLSGTYNQALTLSNPGNDFSGTGSNLTSLNASQLTLGSVPDARLSSNVALRAGGNAFTGQQTVTSGNIGIGTTTPKHTLDVAGNIWLGLQQEGATFSEIGDSLYLGSPRKYLANTLGSPVDGNTDWINLMAHPLSAGIMFGLSGPSDADPHSAPNPLMVIQSNGNVGIGTTNPAAKLEVRGGFYGITQSDGVRSVSTYLDTNGGWFGTRTHDPLLFFVNDGFASMAINTSGSVGIGTVNPPDDTLLQVKGMVRMGSESGTSEAPNRSVLVRRVNTSSSATGQIIARNGALTLERDGTAGGVIVKIATNTGFAPVITATGVTSTGTIVGFCKVVLNGGTAQTIQVFTDAQKIGHYTISFGDPLDQSDLTEVSLTRAVDSLNNTTQWVGTMTSTVNQ